MENNDFSRGIGSTPLIKISDGQVPVYAKCEHMNPGLSLKDRIARNILELAINRKDIATDSTIVCASSGNTGFSVAMVAAHYRIKTIIVTSEKCSEEKRRSIKSLGATLIIRPEDEYMAYANDYAIKNNYFNIDQYNNPDNPASYYQTLGPELWKQTAGKITHFVMTGSTYGCISGTGRFLKEKNPAIQVVLVDPFGSRISSYFPGQTENPDSTPTIIEGAGKGAPTQCLNFSVIDRVIKVSDRDAVATCHALAKEKGIIVGGSSGLNVFAAQNLAKELGSGNVVVTVLCDHGSKYLSKIYNPEFLKSKNLL